MAGVLNPEAPIPLYRQLADDLEERIHSGKLAVGDRIPSEHMLAETHGIGRPTVRQATDYLVRRGLLERRRGSGTFVLMPRTEVDLFTLGGTVAAFEGAGLRLRTSLVEPIVRQCFDETAGPLCEREGFRFARVGCVDQQPVLVERMYLDGAVFPAFDQQRVEEESLSRLVQRHYHRRPTGGHQMIRASQLEAREAGLLKVEPKHGVLVIERSLDFTGVGAAFFARIFVLTDRVVLAQSLTDPLALTQLPAKLEEKA
jgi:GntR family transcriptional regulator